MTHLLEKFSLTQPTVSLRSKRILIIKTTQLGDLVISLPMAAALKQQEPGCVVILLSNPTTVEVARCCPDVDEVYGEPGTAEALRCLLMSLRVDIVIHAHSSKRVTQAAYEAGMPVRIGAIRRAYNWRWCTHLVASTGSLFDVNKRLIDLQYLRPLGIVIDDLRAVPDLVHLVPPRLQPGAPPHPAAFAQGRHSIILSPALVTAKRHQWPLESYSCLIRAIDATRFHWFICGTTDDRAALAPLLARHANDHNVTDMVGRFALPEFMAFIACCDGLIAGSTGPLHLAAALRVRSLGLFQSRKKDIGRWRPVGTDVTVIHSDVACQGERKAKTGDGAACPCIVAIGVDQVAEHVLGWFDSARIDRTRVDSAVGEGALLAGGPGR
jgi:heptosyltransferase-3